MHYCNSLEQLEKMPSDATSLRLYLTDPHLFKHLERFTKLEHLEIYNMNLREIPDSIGNFKRLVTLSVSNAPHLHRISPEIGKLERLETFNVSHHNRLSEFPRELAQCQRMRSALWHINYLQKLPDWIGEWKQLQVLQLVGYHNSYYDCPRVLTPWKGLTDALCGCTDLRQLMLTNLGLNELPDFWQAFPNLHLLDLRNNQLKTLPPSIGKLASLTTFRGDSNFFSDIPSVLLECTKLSELSFLNCWIYQLSPQLAQLPALQSLNLSNNKLYRIPTEIQQCKNLRVLSLRQNRLEALPADFCMPQLQNLDINANQLKSLPDNLRNMQNTLIFFENNPFEEMPLFFLYRNTTAGLHLESKYYPAKMRRHWRELMQFFIDNKIADAHRLGIYHLLCRDKVGMEQHVTLETALQALRSNILLLCEHTWKWLEQRNAKTWKKQQPQAGTTSVALLGTFASGAEVAQQQLEALGIQATTAIAADTTHVFVGTKIGELPDMKQLEHLLIATPAQLTEFLHKNEQFYLAEKPKDTTAEAQPSYASEHLSALLCSQDDQNIAVALEMMATGGVPRDLWTDLYLARQAIKNADLADQCYRLLLLHTQKRMTTLPILRQGAIRKEEWDRIWKAVQGGLLDWKKIEPFLERQKVNYTRFYWLELAPEQRPSEVERYLRAHDYIIDAYIFPDVRMIEDYPQIRGLRMKWYGLKQFPKQVYVLHNLEMLDLYGNSLTDLPDAFSQLQNLKELHITNNNFRKFPAVLDKMPALQTIHCEYNAFATRLHTQVHNGSAIKTIDTERYDLSGLPQVIRRK